MNVIMNEDGKVFVNDHSFIHPLNDNWEKAWNNHKDLFMSPQQMEELEKKASMPKYDVFKADTFGLGMTMITAALLKSVSPAYDFSSYNVNRETVYLYLQNVRQKYSPQLTEFISRMVDFNEDSRPNFITLENDLINLENNLQNSQPVNNNPSVNNFSQLPQPNQPSVNQATRYQNLSNSGTLPNQKGYLSNSPINHSLAQQSQPYSSSQLGNSQNSSQGGQSNFGMKGVNMTGSRRKIQY